MDMTAATKVPSTRKCTRKFLIQKNSTKAVWTLQKLALENVVITPFTTGYVCEQLRTMCWHPGSVLIWMSTEEI